MTAAFGNMAQSEQSGDGSLSLEEWEAASPAERQRMVDLAVSQTDIDMNPETMMAECGACMRFENMQQQYLRGDITRADIMSYYEATGDGALIGLSMLPAGRAVTALGGPVGRFLRAFRVKSCPLTSPVLPDRPSIDMA